MSSLGQRIKGLRLDQGQTTKQVADAIDLTQDTYTRIESDTIIPHEQVLKRIAQYFEVTPEYLLREKNARIRLSAALRNFFYHNKGKAFRILTSIGLIAAIAFPTINLIKSASDKGNPIVNSDNIENIIIGDYNTVIQYKKTDSIIELVDVSILEDGEFPVLDVKLRNSGDTIAFFYKMQFDMIEYYQMKNIHVEHYLPAEPSTNYDIILTDDSIQCFDISQKLPGNDIDRFTVTLATATGDPYVPAICVFSIRLYYNDEEYVESGNMVVPISNSARIEGKYGSYTDMQLAYENYINLIRINKYDAVKSDRFTKILNSYEENKDVFT